MPLMETTTAERRPTTTTSKTHHIGGAVPPPAADQDPLPCPRCDSTNTKFCYYNNYNFSQPRHFCKSCRRYWTHGGTLRDIPIGGGCRKNAKRPRIFTSSSSSCSCLMINSLSSAGNTVVSSASDPIPSTPLFVSLSSAAAPYVNVGDNDMMLKPAAAAGPGGFTSLLNAAGPGFLALGGFGLGLASGLEDVGFGLGRSVWPFSEVGYLGGGGCAAGGGESTWQLGNAGDNGFVGGGECFSPTWPELAISTPGNGLK
ncbi:hypothetical protein Dimus_014332 [Dionaea muscipula]